MTLFEFCQWVQFSPPLVAMRSSPWLFPVIASIHLMGLAMIGGAVFVGDLRLLGIVNGPFFCEQSAQIVMVNTNACFLLHRFACGP